MLPTNLSAQKLRLPSPPPRAAVSESASLPSPRAAISEEASSTLDIADSYVRDPKGKVTVGAAILAGVSLLGVSSCHHQPEVQTVQTVQEAVWPEGDFLDLSLSNVELGTATSQEMREAVDWSLKQSLTLAPTRPGEDRHSLGRRVQSEGTDRVRYDGADLVVIAFEGTGSYHPRKAQVIQQAAARLRDQGLRVDGSAGSLASMVADAIDGQESADSGWSGIARGPLEQLIRDPDLSSKTQLLSFPSEEIEALSGWNALQTARLSQVLLDSVEIYTGETPGIENALQAVRDVIEQAREQGNSPKFMLVSHSSGGRSMVKFLEKARAIHDVDGQPLQFSSGLMIDPVREAHEALFEGGRELLAKGTERTLNTLRETFGLDEKTVYPPLVRHRAQPESLYKPSNLTSLESYFQRRDTEGLKVRPYVGIHGSPVKGAANHEIFDVGSGGHGEIAVHDQIRDAFMAQVEANHTTP